MTLLADRLVTSRWLYVALACAATACSYDTQQRNQELPEVRLDAPSTSAPKPQNLPGVHNVVSYRDQVVCGGVPEGKEGFETLAAMGIRTIVSVDGATPDVAAAEARGMHYVHLPIGYDTIKPERQLQLAQAIANVERPIYVHCHHGKHRSAAALGVALVESGSMTRDEAMARMHVSGTSDSYTGLWAAVQNAVPLAAEELRADLASFPSVTKVSGMVATMAELDQVIDLVKQAHEAGWQAPDDHPDLVATKETRRLADLFASLRSDAESMQHPDDYQHMLGEAIEQSSGLDQAVRAGDAIEAGKLLTALGKTCKQCHKTHRDR